MKKNRNMFYTNNQSGGFFNPNPNMMQPNMPSGFNQNNNYMAYGPGVGPNGVIAPNIGQEANMGYGYEEDSLDSRITKLERQTRKLETRISKLESAAEQLIESSTNNSFII